jgi:superfamily II DNA or RNA helicase
MPPRVVRVVVDNRIRLSPSQLAPGVFESLKAAFTHRNPQHFKLKAMGIRFDHRAQPASIATWSTEGDDECSIPRGGLGRVRAALGEAGQGVHVVDERTEGELPARYRQGFEWPEKLFAKDGDERALYPDQERMVSAMLAEENAVIRGSTGQGKTSCLLAAAIRARLPTIIIVWTGGLFDQWVERIADETGLDKRLIGQVRGGKKTYSPITVAMQQTVAKLKVPGFHRWFGFVGADEVARWGAKSFVASIDPFASRYRLGVSQSEVRKDGMTFLIKDEFGDVAIEVGHDELVRLGRVVDVAVRVHETGWRPAVPGDEEADALLGERELDMRRDYKLLLDAMEADAGRTGLAVDLAEGEARAGHQVLVFSQRVQHCRRMDAQLNARGVRSGLLLGGEDNKQEFRETVRRMRAGEIACAVGTIQAVGLGLDLPTVDRGVVATPIAANKQLFNQVRGRLCRKSDGKGDAVLHYLLDGRVFREHVGNIRAWAKQVSFAETRVSGS